MSKVFQSFESPTCIYIAPNGKWMDYKHAKRGAPQVGDVIRHKVQKTFFHVWLYYANIIDYIRILMTVLALVLIVGADPNPTSWTNISIAVLIMGSVLLDWVDGPVARYFGQSTIMGCGWDWLADIFAQYCLAVWCLSMSKSYAFQVFTVLFTGVEISTGLFDFAVSAQAVYPSSRDDKAVPWYAIVETWLTPHQSYNRLGTFCWLANTAYPIAFCLQMPGFIHWSLFPFAILYAWHEVSQLIFIVHNWKETTASLHQEGIEYVRDCTEQEIQLLKSTFDDMSSNSNQNAAQEESTKEINWINLYLKDQFAPTFASHEKAQEMRAWVEEQVRKNFPNEKRGIISFGYIIAPKHGSMDQTWHFDYTPECGNLFVPMTEVTTGNATQFVRGPLEIDMPKNQYFPEPHVVRQQEGKSVLEVCQVVTKPYVLLKLHPGTMHRGIANREDYDRIMFFISTYVIGSNFVFERDVGEKFYANVEWESAVKGGKSLEKGVESKDASEWMETPPSSKRLKSE